MPGYPKQTWADLDTSKPLSAVRMGHLEDGIEMVDLDVQSEAVTRATGDSTEATNRTNAITAAIATEVTNRNNAIASESSTRVAAEGALDTRIDALEAVSTWTTYRITSDLTRNAVTFADMVGLDAIPVVAGERYDVELDLDVDVSVTAAAGVQITIVAATGSSVTFSEVLGLGWFPTSGSPGVDAFYETVSDITGTVGPSPGSTPGIGTRHRVRWVGSFLAGGTSGNIRVRGRIATVVGGGTATFHASSSRLRIRKVTTVN